MKAEKHILRQKLAPYARRHGIKAAANPGDSAEQPLHGGRAFGLEIAAHRG